MILTVTLNPSVDIHYHIDHFSLDTVNRTRTVSKTAGGKGLNVTRVLRQLEEEVAATGFLGGYLGRFIRNEMRELSVSDFFVEITGETRNCIAIIHEGNQTEILELGPEIDKDEAHLLLDNFPSYISNVDLIVMSGSLPKGLTHEFYEQLLKVVCFHDIPVLLDTKGELLNDILQSSNKPFLIKPNLEELAELIGKTIEEDQIIPAIKSPVFDGIPWIVVTLGQDGAIIRNYNNIYHAKIPKVKAVNAVGSGDSVIAGFAAGLRRQLNGEDLIKFGLTMGVLNAIEEKTGYIDREKIPWCLGKIQVEKIE